MPPTVVITGASAGIGRATARLYARRGADVVLVARGEGGLHAAADEVAALGGRPLVHVADAADPAQLEAAADAAEQAFGPVDVWINCAFATVFAPFEEITAEEFKRVTEVTYLGFVNGTRTALKRMLPRDRGTIVQVGSALGERSIPLQSAYCGAKHAINGFTSSVRTELLHRGSNVRITVAQMPAVNTPQFEWVRSRLAKHPMPVPPIYQPEVAARGVLYAADHPRRKQYYVGASTVATIWANRLFPAPLDRYLARTGFESQQTDSVPPAHLDNLFEPVDRTPADDQGAHGAFDDTAHTRSWQETLLRHPAATALGAGAAVLGTTLGVRRLTGRAA
ncbi:SDR family oxidoreductase [Streptomyces rubradiris]|uniref:Short-chain dehydrogenase n=1 Tax=Streptomyces rubradiris TaxID=285531 RepID=A0ABQ3RC07_STRRR|nr:SDR family oxidoreductase [Streptomyces rubradiris]GHG92729.1 short-chain dehydrogenase [Streptomyces rubradiris]GHI53378.1 short-chain dehydrogenase [Streptomyces rubradiris]